MQPGFLAPLVLLLIYILHLSLVGVLKTDHTIYNLMSLLLSIVPRPLFQILKMTCPVWSPPLPQPIHRPFFPQLSVSHPWLLLSGSEESWAWQGRSLRPANCDLFFRFSPSWVPSLHIGQIGLLMFWGFLCSLSSSYLLNVN